MLRSLVLALGLLFTSNAFAADPDFDDRCKRAGRDVGAYADEGGLGGVLQALIAKQVGLTPKLKKACVQVATSDMFAAYQVQRGQVVYYDADYGFVFLLRGFKGAVEQDSLFGATELEAVRVTGEQRYKIGQVWFRAFVVEPLALPPSKPAP